jgi:DNA-binding CsgD family transcriptional regulator
VANIENLSPSRKVRASTSSAINKAIADGDVGFLYEMFAKTSRELALTGQGKKLLSLSKYAGDDSENGQAMRMAYQMLAYLFDLDFISSQALAHKIEVEASNVEIYDFISKTISYCRAFIAYSNGNLAAANKEANIALYSQIISTDLEGGDRASIIRLKAGCSFAYADLEDLTDFNNEINSLKNKDSTNNFAYHQVAVKSMLLCLQGEYLKAYDLAKSVVAMSEVNGYAGISAPLDCKYVIAFCLFEFGKPNEALAELEEVKKLSLGNKSNFWYFFAESLVIRLQISSGLSDFAKYFGVIDSLRQRAKDFPESKDLGWIADLAELHIRNMTNDWPRALILINRLPDISYVKFVKDSLEFRRGKVTTLSEVQNLTEETPAHTLWKNIYLSEFPKTSTFHPRLHMEKALEIGERTGARDIFIRQAAGHINLIIEISKINPTVFLEQLTKDCINRLKERSELEKIKNGHLTDREMHVLRHLSTGKSIEEIGKSLHISKNTMKTHLRNIYKKMNVNGRAEAAEKAKELLIV